MNGCLPIDLAWRRKHPLPLHAGETDKNGRGRVLVVGGAEFVPGALRLTGEAALRSGAGKLQMATVRAAAMSLGVLVPEAAMIALPADEDGEIAMEAAAILTSSITRCDTLILGPGMSVQDHSADLVRSMLDTTSPDLTVVLDAAAIACAGDLAVDIARHRRRIVMTPHYGEMAALTGIDADRISADPVKIACDTARRFGAIIVLKAAKTIVASPDGEPLFYTSGCAGLATGGSGDVLAGIIGGLLAQGTDPVAAAAWGVWLHGEAGRAAAKAIGPIGFLARDLAPLVPGLRASASE
jgi:hydroxyethylthiazole kinase-like uncharacterized protein yjeF